MSTTTALKVSPSTNAASASTPTKDRSAKRNSTLLESTNTVSTNLGGENKLKISPEDITSPLELTDYVDSILNNLEEKFDEMSSQVLSRMSQMSSRVDALEASIQDIINGDITTSIPQSPAIGGPQIQHGSHNK